MKDEKYRLQLLSDNCISWLGYRLNSLINRDKLIVEVCRVGSA